MSICTDTEEECGAFSGDSGNGGDSGEAYFICSADWRPRNLSRRVEVVTPVFDAAARSKLDALLTTELQTTDAWMLRADGGYDRLSSSFIFRA